MRNSFTTVLVCVAGLAALAGSARAEEAETAPVVTYRQEHALVGDEGSFPFDAKLAKGRDGNFYGTTRSGGPLGSGGTAFRMTPRGETQVLHAFGPLEGGEASMPSGLTWGPDGHFYGVTTFGGSDGFGSFYRMSVDGEVTLRYSFKYDQDVPNYWPRHGLMLSGDGRFYGTTESTVYGVTPGGEATVLFSFKNKHGRSPNGGLIEDDAGHLYGTASSGGAFSRGTVFRLTKAGVLTVLHSFAGHRADGASPRGGLALVDGMLYGVTHQGGQHRQGAVFRLSTTGGSYQVLHSFKSAKSAPYWPSAGLTLAPDGWLYGASERGGIADGGTLYRINAAGQLTLLHSFGEKRHDGVRPMSDLLLTGQHTFHGTTDSGGVADQGTVYKLRVTD